MDEINTVTTPTTTLIASVDTSSIIENKKSTKEYWEKRMMAEMGDSMITNGTNAVGTTNAAHVDHQLLIDTGDLMMVPSPKMMTPTSQQQHHHPQLMVATANSKQQCFKRLIVSSSSNPGSPKGCNSPLLLQGAHHHQLSSPSSGVSPGGGGGMISSPVQHSPASNGGGQSVNGSQYNNNNARNNGLNSSKLGSDGESEASPECSLSPVEVDSLEGGSSRDSSTCDQRSSPDYINCTHDDDEDHEVDHDDDDHSSDYRDCESSPDAGISGCCPVDDEMSTSMSPEITTTNATTAAPNVHSVNGNGTNNSSNHRRTLSSVSSSSLSSSPLPSSPVIGQNPKSSPLSSFSPPVTSPPPRPLSSSSLPSPSSASPLPGSCHIVANASTPKTPTPTINNNLPVPTTDSSVPVNGHQHTDPQLTRVPDESEDNVTEPDSLEDFIKHETECAQQQQSNTNSQHIDLNSFAASEEVLIDSLSDSGLCQNSSSSILSPTAKTAFDGDLLSSLPKSTSSSDNNNQDNQFNESLSCSPGGYNKIVDDSGVNFSSDDLLLMVDCSAASNSTRENLMTNLTNSSSSSISSPPLSSSSNPPSSSSHNNNVVVSSNNKNKGFPGKNKEDTIYANNDDNDDVVDDDSVDNSVVAQNDIQNVHNHQQNGIEIVSLTTESAVSVKGINSIGDGIDRPTIIGQLTKPSDDETSRPMLLNVSEENIIEVKPTTTSSPTSSATKSTLSALSTVSSSPSRESSRLSTNANEPVSMLVNYDESEQIELNSQQQSPSSVSVSDEDAVSNNLLLVGSKSSPITISGGESIASCDSSRSSASLRPLAGIVGKQTGKIVKRESSSSAGIIKSSAESMIAEEIRQLKEREEELARMRLAMSKQQQQQQQHQQLSSSSSTPIVGDSHHLSKGSNLPTSTLLSSGSLHHLNGSTTNGHHHGPTHHHPSHNSHHPHHQLLGKSTPSHCSSIDGKSSPALSDLSSCSVGTISNDSIDPAPSKPISLEILSGKVSGLLGESPIEREIRISREREAELKAQVHLTRCLSNSINPESQTTNIVNPSAAIASNLTTSMPAKEGHINGGGPIMLSKTMSMDETIVTSTGTKLPVFKQNSCGAANAADIQKLLATTRIQQEIEEQTQRELALKATGSIKTISQERTDLKVTKLTDNIEKAGSTYSSITHQINANNVISPTTLTASNNKMVLNPNPNEPQPVTAKTIETLSSSSGSGSSGIYNNGLTGNSMVSNNYTSGLSNGLSLSSSSSLLSSSNSNLNNNTNLNTVDNRNTISIIQSNNNNNAKPIIQQLSTVTTEPPPASATSAAAVAAATAAAAAANLPKTISTIKTTPTTSTFTKKTTIKPSSSLSSLSSSLVSVASAGSSASSSSASSSSASSGGTSITSIRRTGFQPFMKKGLTKSISMHKFISSKGKTATPTGNPTSSAFYPLTSPSDLYGGEIRPPIMVKGDKGFRRGSVSAESKIQEELKEMKAREEELRRQRARLMGLSQPNLALIGRDDDDDDDGGHHDDGEIDHLHHNNRNGNDEEDEVDGSNAVNGRRNGSLYEIDAGLKRTTSNPNISHEFDQKVCQQFGNSLKPRKNPLIAQWEKKIIKDNPN